MKAFVSYSHQDNKFLDILHKHLAQLKREGMLTTWTDREIHAGSQLDAEIETAITSSSIFIALISPDYIASNYCYEREFQKALSLQESGQLTIIPVIVEPSDWLNTPFQKFKALPKDGKAISLWDNVNTAFLDVVQNIRKLIMATTSNNVKNEQPGFERAKNYRVQKDFDSIERIEFLEKTFTEIKTYFRRFADEITQLENIKSLITNDRSEEFTCLIVNRNKIASEAHITISIKNENDAFSRINMKGKTISYSIQNGEGSRISNQKSFILSHDEYALFWLRGDSFYNFDNENKYTAKDIANYIWNEALQSIGIYE